MPARSKSPKFLIFTGAYRKNPARAPKRAAPHQSLSAGEPPEHLKLAEAAAWRELLELAPAGFIERSDRLHIELIARLIVRTRTGKARTTDFLALRLALRDAGLAPDVREKFAAGLPTEKEDSSFADV